jgi:hypothetical protein
MSVIRQMPMNAAATVLNVFRDSMSTVAEST